ncbi:MAG: hypothetical protein ACPLXC_00800 [Candidatus Pacearchaeota archaeon]
MTWRKGLSKELRYHLEKIILESYSHKHAITHAKDKGKAQLWVALAILQKKITELELKTAYLERTLQQFFPRKKQLSENERKKQEAEVEAILKNLVTGKRFEAKLNTKRDKRHKKRHEKGRSSIKIAKSL